MKIKLTCYPEGCTISKKIKKEIKKMLMNNMGTSISIKKQHPIPNSSFTIYSEIEENPLEIFSDMYSETNYLFGAVDLKRPKKKVFFLIDIDQLISIGKEMVIMPSCKETKKVYVCL